MAVNFTFDTETLAVGTRAVILSIGIVPFEFENPKSFKQLCKGGIHIKLNAEDQIRRLKRKVDKSTLQFWKDQCDEAKWITKPSEQDVLAEDALETVNEFITNNAYDPKESWLWSRGNVFDFAKIETLYEDCAMTEAYHGKRQRDIRTMIDCFCLTTDGYIKPQGDIDGFVKHNALHDAALDSMNMQQIFQRVLNGE